MEIVKTIYCVMKAFPIVVCMIFVDDNKIDVPEW
jgi:hypothetical protein